eukprot:Amastigsp_a676391_915.p3 type:complete len:103 gc:universal Amastigsp_a676391_915:461-769(+)
MNDMTRCESSLGTGNRCLRILVTRSPSGDVKLSKMRCGYASETVSRIAISCRVTTPERLKYAVGPCGRWQMMSPSGMPRCSSAMMMSVTWLARHASTKSFMR